MLISFYSPFTVGYRAYFFLALLKNLRSNQMQVKDGKIHASLVTKLNEKAENGFYIPEMFSEWAKFLQ